MRRELRVALRKRRCDPSGAGGGLAPGRGARRPRPAVQAVSGDARGDQVAARGPCRFSPPVRRQHRSVARAAAAGGRAAGAARAAQAEVRPGAGGRHRAPRRLEARARRLVERRRADRRARAGGRRRAYGLSDRRREAVEGASPHRQGFRQGARDAGRRAGHGTHPVRRPVWGWAIARISLERAGHRRRRVLRLAEPRRGSPAARAHRLGRRALARDAGDQDADRDDPSRVQRRDRSAAGRIGAGADFRRGGCRHRWPRRRRRRPQAADARLCVPGALHHAPAADRRVCGHTFRDRQAGRWRAHAHDRSPAGRGRPGRGARADARRRSDQRWPAAIGA